MDTTLDLVPDRREGLGGTLVLSFTLHLLLFASALIYLNWGPHFGGRWGQGWNEGSATRVNAVTSLPGVPLAAPTLSTPSTLATENPGLYKEPPKPKPEPVPEAEPIPKFQEAPKPVKPLRVNKRIQKETVEPPDNAIPFGEGGKPSMAYSQFVNAAGGGSVTVGDGNFSDRYGWYVAAVRNRISSNWLLSTISPSLVTAPRVYLTFDILRDGTVTNAQLTQSSGIPEVDRSALRAVLASNPLGPLPPDYAGNKVSVEFYFDFRRGR